MANMARLFYGKALREYQIGPYGAITQAAGCLWSVGLCHGAVGFSFCDTISLLLSCENFSDF